MMDNKWIEKSGIMLSVFLIINLVLSAGTPMDGNGSGAFATGKYRNLFEENGHSKKEIAQKISMAFNQLFHGDSAHAVYFEAGKNEQGPLAYLSDVSES